MPAPGHLHGRVPAPLHRPAALHHPPAGAGGRQRRRGRGRVKRRRAALAPVLPHLHVTGGVPEQSAAGHRVYRCARVWPVVQVCRRLALFLLGERQLSSCKGLRRVCVPGFAHRELCTAAWHVYCRSPPECSMALQILSCVSPFLLRAHTHNAPRSLGARSVWCSTYQTHIHTHTHTNTNSGHLVVVCQHIHTRAFIAQARWAATTRAATLWPPTWPPPRRRQWTARAQAACSRWVLVDGWGLGVGTWDLGREGLGHAG